MLKDKLDDDFREMVEAELSELKGKSTQVWKKN